MISITLVFVGGARVVLVLVVVVVVAFICTVMDNSSQSDTLP